MILDRREALAASAAWVFGSRALAAEGSGLTFAPDAEVFWRKLPFLDRLRKVAEAGFARYEFGHWRTKDFPSVLKLDEDLNLQPSRFFAFAGIGNPKRKDACLAAVEDAASVASKLDANRLTIIAGPLADGLDHDDQVDAAGDALKESAEKLGESEAILILDPFEPPTSRSKPLLADFEEAIGVIKEVGSKRVRLLLDVDRIASGEGEKAALIARHTEWVGSYRVGPGRVEPGVLRAIARAGHAEPVGVGFDPKGDPAEAIRMLRETDAGAK